MDLWIRSQNKKRLIHNPQLYLVTTEEGYSYIGDAMVGHIIKYKNEKRALEVLDEIQNILKSKIMIRMDENVSKAANFLNIDGEYARVEGNADIKNINNNYVYEMPQE